MYFEISEERIDEQVYHDERCENGVQDTHENETSPQPANSRQLRRWYCLVNYAPVNQRRSIFALQEHLPHSSPSIKQVLHQTELEIPFEGARERPALSHLRGPPVREWDSQVKQLLVEKRNEEVLLPHDTVRDVVRV